MQRLLPTFFLILGDYFAIVIAQFVSFFIRNEVDFWNHVFYMYSYKYILIFVPATFIIFLTQADSYRQMKPIVETMRTLFLAIFYAWTAAIIIIYFLKASNQASRLFIFLLLPTTLCNICIARYTLMKIFKIKNIFTEKIILIGTGSAADKVIKFWQEDLGYRYHIAGIFSPKDFKNIPLNKINTVIIAQPDIDKILLQKIISNIQPHVEHFSFIPDLIGTPMSSADISVLFTEKILMLNLRNNLANKYNRLFKRIFDLILTITGGLLILPLIIFIAIAVAFDNHGNIIFAHKRIGKNGNHFFCYKFQTMNQNFNLNKYLKNNPAAAKEWHEHFKLSDDPRVSKFGAFLRKYSLDELPQLFNVLKGDMSLVGPRPIVDAEVPKYGKFIRDYFLVTPGITGFWQVNGRSDTTYDERVQMDSWYVRNWSVWIDILYLFKTVKAVISAKGAY